MSEWVRRRGCDKCGFLKCWTCGKRVHWKRANAGHFIHKKFLDFDEINIQAQDVYCNLRLHGNLGRFAYQIVKKYGMKELGRLESLRYVDRKIKRQELEKIIIKLKNKILNL